MRRRLSGGCARGRRQAYTRHAPLATTPCRHAGRRLHACALVLPGTGREGTDSSYVEPVGGLVTGLDASWRRAVEWPATAARHVNNSFFLDPSACCAGRRCPQGPAGTARRHTAHGNTAGGKPRSRAFLLLPLAVRLTHLTHPLPLASGPFCPSAPLPLSAPLPPLHHRLLSPPRAGIFSSAMPARCTASTPPCISACQPVVPCTYHSPLLLCIQDDVSRGPCVAPGRPADRRDEARAPRQPQPLFSRGGRRPVSPQRGKIGGRGVQLASVPWTGTGSGAAQPGPAQSI